MDSRAKWEILKGTKKGLMTDYLALDKIDAAVKQALGVTTERALLDALGSDFYYLSTRDISQNEGFMKCYQKPLFMDETHRKCALGIT